VHAAAVTSFDEPPRYREFPEPAARGRDEMVVRGRGGAGSEGPDPVYRGRPRRPAPPTGSSSCPYLRGRC